MSDERNAVRRRLAGQQEIAILREHLLEKTPVSEVCDRHSLDWTAFYRSQKEFFENGAAAFEMRRAGGDAKMRRLEERIEKLQAKMAPKDKVIAELMEDHVRAKKSLAGTRMAPGRSRTCATRGSTT